MQDIVNSLLSAQILPFWVLVCAVLLERFINWPDKYHPLSFIKALADGMANKVLSADQHSIKQQKISGSLAFIVILLPFVAIFTVLIYLSEYPIFFDAIMLFVALRFNDVINTTKKVSSALIQDKKILARQTLTHIVLRETEKMSPLGLVKANIEAMLLRYAYQYCSVIFWYILAGGLGALIYRIIYELALAWNSKLFQFKYFGQSIRVIASLLQWLPSLLATLSIVIAINIYQGIKALLQPASYRSLHLFILNVCGSSLGIELSGPAYYNQHKVRSQKCGGKRQIILADNNRVLSVLDRATWVWLTLYFLGCALSFYAQTA